MGLLTTLRGGGLCGNWFSTDGTGAVAPVIWSGDGVRKPMDVLGSSAVRCPSSGKADDDGVITSGAPSVTTALSRLLNCPASRRSTGSGTAAWARSMSSVPSSGRIGRG